ncbi:MAG: putative immunity protein, partial [Bordetella sp.]|nr:hypothetical protein [Pseudomonadota bacterium]
MNHALERVARTLDLDSPVNERLRLAFAHACVQRVAHLLEDPQAVAALQALGRFLAGETDRDALARVAADAARLANRHPGSRSLDGCGHAAVSATYAVACAVAGKALQAADYAAYAAVYGQGGYGAVADPESFEPEYAWQAERLTMLAEA